MSASRSAVAVFAVMIAASGLASAASASPVRSGPVQVTVIPQDQPVDWLPERIAFAGKSGVLGILSGGFSWTTYATGQTDLVNDLPFFSIKTFTAGPDTVGLVSGQQVGTLNLVTLHATSRRIPSRYSILGVHGDQVVVTPNGQPGAKILTFYGSTTTTTGVTGLPQGANVLSELAGDQSSVVISYEISRKPGCAVVDLSSGKATVLAGTGPGVIDSAVLTPTGVAVYDGVVQTVHVYSRADLSAAPTIVQLPASGWQYSVAMTGGAVIAALSYTANTPAIAVPISGGAAVTALPHVADGLLFESPDGTVVAMGGTDKASFGFQRMTADVSGNVTVTAVPRLSPVTAADAGITITQGVVRHTEGGLDAGGDAEYQMFDHPLEPASAFDNGNLAPPSWFGPLFGAVACSAGASCVRSVDNGSFGTNYLMKPTTGQLVAVRFWSTVSFAPLSGISVPSANGTVVDASDVGEVINGSDPARQYVITDKIVSARPITGAGLWYSTLWRSDGAGRLRATDIATMKPAGSIMTGSGCVASDVQVALRWIYWSCGASDPSGVYDLKTKRNIAVPSGQALLGDGYLVIAKPAGPGTVDLVEYDFHADAVAAPVAIANVPAGPGLESRNITWSVDKYGGDIAYVDAGDAVHVIDPKVPRSWPATYSPAGVSSFPASVDFTSPGAHWGAGVLLYSPISSWRLEIRRRHFGPVVFSAHGGAVAQGFGLTWNGLLAGRQRAFSGVYDWSLGVVPPDGAGLVVADRGTLTVFCGQIPFRASDCSGTPSLLAIRFLKGHSGFTDQWQAHWVTEDQPGRQLVAQSWFADFPFCAAPSCVSSLIPFGDTGHDYQPDLLVRYRNGTLRLDRGPDYAAPSVVIGKHFNRYTLLAAPGDLTGDRIADLVAVDKAGRLWLYAGTGHNRFLARRIIGRNFGRYVRLVGCGDLTGRGIGDLLSIDRHGAMWRYDGNGRGGLNRRVRVSGGWSGYNAVIGIGDLNYDGTNDLVARDQHGNLWLFVGNGHGAFARRTLISAGWQRYKFLF